MRAQRVREGESRVEMQSAKWTAEGTVKRLWPEYSVTCRHTSVAGICQYPAKRMGFPMNQGGTADLFYRP